MPRSFFDQNLLANMVAKLGNIVGERVKFDMFANNVGQFGHTFREMFSGLETGAICPPSRPPNHYASQINSI